MDRTARDRHHGLPREAPEIACRRTVAHIDEPGAYSGPVKPHMPIRGELTTGSSISIAGSGQS